MIARQAHWLISAAGWLSLAAVAGSWFVDAAWWALTPAAILLSVGLASDRRLDGGGVARVGRIALTIVLVGLLATTAAGFVASTRLGFEPAWVGSATTAAGFAVLGAAVILGTGIFMQNHRLTGVLLACALPLGWSLDWLMEHVAPPGLFLTGNGVYVGMILFAIGLIRLGRPGTAASITPSMAAAPRRRRRYRSGAYAGTL